MDAAKYKVPCCWECEYSESSVFFADAVICNRKGMTVGVDAEGKPKDCPLRNGDSKVGRWMHDKDDSLISGYCSCCGWLSIICETDVAGMPFCPNCGAKMEV